MARKWKKWRSEGQDRCFRMPAVEKPNVDPFSVERKKPNVVNDVVCGLEIQGFTETTGKFDDWEAYPLGSFCISC